MAVIDTIVYRDSKLQAPDIISQMQAKLRLSFAGQKQFPTFDIGYTHVFRITAFGLTYDQAEQTVKRKLGRFYRKMHQVEGFAEINVEKREDFIPVNRNHSITYDITYAIERTGSHTQSPDSPYPEYQEDLTKLTHAPETAAGVFGRR